MMFIGGERMKKEVVLTTEVVVQQKGTNIFATLPSSVRSILKPVKGQTVEYVIYSDRSIEIRMKEE